MVFGLPYREVWGLDFEFVARPGERPDPVCLVAREMGSGRLLRLWRDELPKRPPFDVGPDNLFIAYLASAELGCFLQLGWPLPVRVLDLYVEFRRETNGLTLPAGRGLLGALAYHRITGITADEKAQSRALVMRDGPWTDDEQQTILDYCQSDADALMPLLERMLPAIAINRQGLGQSLLRGRYMCAVARMEQAGVPIDVSMLQALRDKWDRIKADLIAGVDLDYGVYDGTTFKAGLFAAWLHDRRIPWPHTPTGQLSLDSDTFKDQARAYPDLEPLYELRRSLAELRLEKLEVGGDGRNRCLLGPFGASSGRNTPSATKFVFGPSAWLRGLIKPATNMALAYIDYTSQEIAIAAALSGDDELLAAVQSGDPYLAFAIKAGLAPPDATKATHRQVRDRCKTCVLGVNYGMGATSLAYRIGGSVLDAEHLMRLLARAYPVFSAWSAHVVNVAEMTRQLSSVYGWPIRVGENTRSTSMRNYLMQSNGAEMLRVAICLATEAGVTVCAPVHDAVLIEAPAAEIDDAVETTRAAMAQASVAVLAGVEVATDVAVVRWPERYCDPRGRAMWAQVSRLLGTS